MVSADTVSTRSSPRRPRRPRLTTGQRLCNCLRGFIAFVCSNVGIVVLFIGFAILGAFVFCQIEGADEQLRKYRMVVLRRNVVNELWTITRRYNVMFQSNWTRQVDAKIMEYQDQVVRAYAEGYDGKNESTLQWTFSGGFLYSLTVMTTIGYGNIAPRTNLGKVSTVLYTCVGFPLFLLFLSNIGTLLAHSFKWLYAKLCRCQPTPLTLTVNPANVADQGGGPHPANTRSPEGEGEAEGEEEEDGTSCAASSSAIDLATITVPVSMCLLVMAAYIAGGALFFARLERWDFLTSCYFCFISLSTIGFGDYVPGDSIRSDSGGVEVGFVLTSMYLMLGMAIIAMCFNLIQEEVVQKVRTCARCLGFMRWDSS